MHGIRISTNKPGIFGMLLGGVLASGELRMFIRKARSYTILNSVVNSSNSQGEKSNGIVPHDYKKNV